MSDKYISLSIDDALGLLRNWRRDSTRLVLKLSSLSGVSFEGTVRVMEVDAVLSVRFACVEGDAGLGVTLLNANLLRTSTPDADDPRWFACRCEPDLRFVLSEEEINLDDFDLASMREQ